MDVCYSTMRGSCWNPTEPMALTSGQSQQRIDQQQQQQKDERQQPLLSAATPAWGLMVSNRPHPIIRSPANLVLFFYSNIPIDCTLTKCPTIHFLIYFTFQSIKIVPFLIQFFIFQFHYCFQTQFQHLFLHHLILDCWIIELIFVILVLQHNGSQRSGPNSPTETAASFAYPSFGALDFASQPQSRTSPNYSSPESAMVKAEPQEHPEYDSGRETLNDGEEDDMIEMSPEVLVQAELSESRESNAAKQNAKRQVSRKLKCPMCNYESDTSK